MAVHAPRRAQPVSGQADVSYRRTALMWAALIRRSRPSGPRTGINGTRPVRRSPIARSISSTVSCTSNSSPSMKSITDSICPATTPTLHGGIEVEPSHFSSSRNRETGMSSGIRPLPRQVRSCSGSLGHRRYPWWSAVSGCFSDPLPPPAAQSFEGIEIGITMTDRHVRLLAAVARHRERQRDDRRPSDTPASGLHHADLSHRAIRARKQLSAARARRRLASHDSDS